MEFFLLFIPQRCRSAVVVLTGPAGCGKTATIHALSCSMGYSVVEWSNSVDLVPLGLLEESEFGWVSFLCYHFPILQSLVLMPMIGSSMSHRQDSSRASF